MSPAPCQVWRCHVVLGMCILYAVLTQSFLQGYQHNTDLASQGSGVRRIHITRRGCRVWPCGFSHLGSRAATNSLRTYTDRSFADCLRDPACARGRRKKKAMPFIERLIASRINTKDIPVL